MVEKVYAHFVCAYGSHYNRNIAKSELKKECQVNNNLTKLNNKKKISSYL